MNTEKMVAIALKRAIELEQEGNIEKANHFLQLAISAEERGKKQEEDKEK